jgi:metallophosphoesterase (TIGR00282 family)
MNILYIGDVMAEPGINVVERVLPKLRTEKSVDFVIAQAENVSDGKSMTVADMKRLQKAGVDFFTGGNHTHKKDEIHSLLADPNSPVIGPANMHDCPGAGFKIVETSKGRVLIVSLLGAIVGRDADTPVDNPLHTIDKILEQQSEDFAAIVVNFHGDFSSEKVIIGHYLDGRASLVVGDHWHIPTADARVLPKGTAHITDVGMCGTLDSSLGVTFASVLARWKDGRLIKNEIETTGLTQFCAVMVSTSESSLVASSIEQIRYVDQ